MTMLAAAIAAMAAFTSGFCLGCVIAANVQRKRDADIAWGAVDEQRNMARHIARLIEEG